MKLKSVILSFALTLFAVSGLLAQDKYEFAVVKYVPNGGNKTYEIWLSKVDGLTKEKGELTEPWGHNFVPLTKYIGNQTNEGWEVHAVNQEVYVITYHLRKKKN